jgi:putative ABC transport system permease protein
MQIWQDLRYSARLLFKHPGFTVTAVCVLALGIGVNAGIFGIINGLLLRPLPGGAAAGDVVGLYSKDRTAQRGYRAFSYAGFADVRDAGGPFQTIAAHNMVLAGITENNVTRQTLADVISTGYFETLGVRPIAGRDFSVEEERPGSLRRSVIVNYRYWERLDFTRDILERTVRINGQDYAIIGVAPEGFGGTTAIIGTEFFLPLGVHDEIENEFDSRAHRALADRQTYALVVIGRLKPDLTLAQADEQLKVIAAAHEQAYPAENRNQDLLVRPLSRLGVSTSPSNDDELWAPMALLQGLAGAVLLTACLNLANMMLAFGTARQKEIAIRLAIGGGRGRIITQLLIQGLLLSLMGGAVGVVAASWAAQALVSTFTTVLPISIMLNVTPDMSVVAATLVFCTIATVMFGLWPALRLSRPDLLVALKDHAGEITGRLGRRITVRGALVTAQLALSLALLVVSGLFVRGAAAGASDNPGFQLDPIIVAHIEPKLGGYDATRSREARRSILERLRAIPGVELATTTTVVPFGDFSISGLVQRDGPRLKYDDPDARGKLISAMQYEVGTDYFRTLGLSMLRGREFTAAEEHAAAEPLPVIIDAPLAAKLFAGEDPIGQVLQFGAQSGSPESKPMTIVGVAPGVRHDLFSAEPEPHVYLPSGANNAARMFMYVRAAVPQQVEAMLPAVRQAIGDGDAATPILGVSSFRSQHERGAIVWILRAAARLFLTLGLAAAFVAVVGLYGVRSYLVSRRRREFGVRMAVGASPLDVMRLVMREAATTTAVGLAIGLGLGMLMGWGLSRLIYQVSPFDPITLGGATAILAVASIVASLVPARRAAGISPSTAIRAD